MEYKYQVKGMSCPHCQNRVQKALNGIDGVEATVSLDPAVAIVKSDKEVAVEKLQEALSAVGDYIIEK